MRKFLQNFIIIFLLAVLTGVSIGMVEVQHPGFAIFALGTITSIALVAWYYLEKMHELVVGGMKYILSEQGVGGFPIIEEERCRGSTGIWKRNDSNYFLGRFTPAKVSISKDKVKPFNVITENKSDPVRSGIVKIGDNLIYKELYYMKNEELHRFLDYCVQNRMQTGIRYALNVLKARANGERFYSASLSNSPHVPYRNDAERLKDLNMLIRHMI